MKSIIPVCLILLGLLVGCASPDTASDAAPNDVSNATSDAASDSVSDSVSDAAPPPANTADVESIDAIMKAYYEVVSGPAGAVPDKDRDVSLHHPDHWIAIANTDANGKPTIQSMNIDGFYGDLKPREDGFFEWETERVVHRHKNMATVWSHYATAKTEGGEPFNTGVNTITLWFDGSRWWIMNWMFDRSS
jgi:hypothetical protein